MACGGVKLCIEQKSACEVNEQKRQFLRAVHPGLKKIFGQAEDLVNEVATDTISGNTCIVDSSGGVVFGFPCTDASLLNIRARSDSNRRCISTKSKRTGKVFDDIVKHLAARGADNRWFIAENGLALDQAPKAKDCKDKGKVNQWLQLFVSSVVRVRD